MIKNAILAALLLAGMGSEAPARAAEGEAKGDTSKKVLALANNYAGNVWRQAMVAAWGRNGAAAVQRNAVAQAPSFTTAENSVTEQAQQVRNLVLQGVDAIAVDAASPTALNGAVKDACDADIVVVSFDQVVTEPCAYKVATDNRNRGRREVDYLAQRLNGRGNLLELRGQVGGAVDADIHAGAQEALRKYPNLKIVGEARGDWTQTIAQREVSGLLPTLPKIDGVITQGGDGYGTAQAFLAAGRPLPIIILGNESAELKFWKQQRDANGYETISLRASPSVSQMAFWIAQQVLAGKQVPKQMTIPLLEVGQDSLDYWLARTPEGGVTTATCPLDWTVAAIDAVAGGKPVPDFPQVR